MGENIRMEKLELKWTEFQSNVSSSFMKLRSRSEFHDVTLVSDDQKQISAHKVVLSICSGYLNNILEKNKHPHPMICLDGINSAQLENILDYAYFGEVQVYEDEINKFLDVARRLKLDGIELDGSQETASEEEKESTIHDEKMPVYIIEDETNVDESIKKENQLKEGLAILKK